MNLAAVGTGVSVNAPNNPGATTFYARVGAPSPADPNTEQLITDRGPADWMNTIQNSLSSALGFLSVNSPVSNAAQGLSTTAVKKAGFEAAKIKGEVGKVYYGAVSAVSGAVASTAKTAQTVAKGFAWGSFAIVAIIGVVLLAQFRIAAKGV